MAQLRQISYRSEQSHVHVCLFLGSGERDARCRQRQKGKWYDYLGTRYASVYDASKLNRDPNTAFSYVNVKPFNFDQLSWNNNLKEFQHPDWKDESDGFQQMEVGSVNATCFTVDITSTGVNPSYGMRYSTQYPAALTMCSWTSTTVAWHSPTAT